MHQAIFDIVELAALKGLTRFVISPGSRPAPLTLAVARNQKVQKWVIPDERAAAFIALGMADASKSPVALVCTSGSAGLNYYPALAEAFYREIPLVVFTADRPPEWIDQLDGQTVRQRDVFKNHIKKSFDIPVDTSHPDAVWQVNRLVNEAINLAREEPAGPVHINVPLREPLYPEKGKLIQFTENLRVIESHCFRTEAGKTRLEGIHKALQSHRKILIAVGQADGSDDLNTTLGSIIKKQGIPVLADVIGNVDVPGKISAQDLFLGAIPENLKTRLQPDLLITIGKSFISKNFKTYIRKYRPQAHWHICGSGQVADTFQCLTKVVRMEPYDFMEWLNGLPSIGQEKGWLDDWSNINVRALGFSESWFETRPFSEALATKVVLSSIPENSSLHLSNSMPVRYCNFFGTKPGVKVKANRGTSGIDGCTSTTVGHALATGKLVTLITGDMAFFYDRNAFWHNYPLPNLRVVLMNNHAGGIFRMLPGAKDLPELETYFETYQPLGAENTCRDFGIGYKQAKDLDGLNEALDDFFEQGNHAKLIEIKLDSVQTAATFEEFKRELKKYLEND